MRRDLLPRVWLRGLHDFNPLSSSEERPIPCSKREIERGFQSTLLKWGETAYQKTERESTKISIHSPQVRRDIAAFRKKQVRSISIHSPQVRRDVILWFYKEGLYISIHSPQVRRDLAKVSGTYIVLDFNPLSSSEERPEREYRIAAEEKFQSTLLKWGETYYRHLCKHNSRFQSTLLKWGETADRRKGADTTPISIHSPQVRRDVYFPPARHGFAISIHSPQVRRDSSPATDLMPLR